MPSIISGDLKITGNLESSGDIQVDGRVEGDISSRTLTVGEESSVSGSIVAESVRVCGHVKGEIKCTSVVLAKTARVEGDIAHESLAIEAGAYIEGNIRRLEPEQSNAEPRVSVIKSVTEEPAPPVAPVAVPGATTATGGGSD
ncbi:MAG: polymer-forming cytoskeletal protein [Kiloniellales bacterium]|nr:polymer-forming cytoskeletal protein [Kiloniellales bacterium]